VIIANILQKHLGISANFVSITSDTRVDLKYKIFLALKGANFDGHDFIVQALDSGAVAAISHREADEYPESYRSKIYKVEDTFEFYHQLANEYRKAINPITIAITGSSGKTTTKELMQLVMSQKFKTHFTQANNNNEFGVPLTILSMPEDTQVLIVEMGMRGLKQIELLSKTTNPNIAVITNIGTAHIEILGSRENIKKAKLEIASGLISRQELEATLLVDESIFSEIAAMNLARKTLSFDSQKFVDMSVLESTGLFYDINAVRQVAYLLGLDDGLIKQGLLQYKPLAGRGLFKTLKDSKTIFIDETYNANPDAVYNSINALSNQFANKNKIAVIGNIAESLPELVEKLFVDIAAMPNLTLIDARNKDLSVVAAELNSKLTGEDVVLVKASRSAKLERLFDSYRFS
jgi:UDP-N-acetylmuramoyl-tripeptide--D-alanyl-D-alanine ligase